MAPPPNRRPGFSRRAQYGLFLTYVVAVGGILFSAMLLLIAALDPRGFNALQGAALDVGNPVRSGGRQVVRFFRDIGSGVGNYFFAASQNDELKRQLAASRRELLKAKATNFENQRLKRLAGLVETTSDEIVSARVTSSSFTSPRRFAVLSAGGTHGVQVGQPVRSAEGLIGRIYESGRYASRILLVTDSASNVPVRLVRNGVAAIATGKGDGTIDLKTLEVGSNPFRRGDVLVTSGLGGVYPPGIPVAIVMGTDHDTTLARPAADPARIDFAIVQPVFVPEAGQAAPETPQ